MLLDLLYCAIRWTIKVKQAEKRHQGTSITSRTNGQYPWTKENLDMTVMQNTSGSLFLLIWPHVRFHLNSNVFTWVLFRSKYRASSDLHSSSEHVIRSAPLHGLQVTAGNRAHLLRHFRSLSAPRLGKWEPLHVTREVQTNMLVGDNINASGSYMYPSN